MSVKSLTIAFCLAIAQFAIVSSLMAADDDDDVLVTNTWAEVTRADYYLELSRLPEQYRGSIEVSGKRVVELIDKILTRKSLASQARELNMDDEELTQRRIHWLIDETLSQVRIERLELAAASEFDSKFEKFEARAAEMYSTGKSTGDFRTEVLLQASHILVDFEDRTVDEATLRINEARDKALAGNLFEGLVLEYSDDPTAQQNKGDLGSFGSGKMVKSFEDAAFALEQPGDISAVVETSYGLHIIKLIKRSGGVLLTYEQAKPIIMGKLRADYVKRVRVEHMQLLDADETMTIDEKAIDSLIVPTNS